MSYSRTFRLENLRRRHEHAPMPEERFQYLKYLFDRGTSPRQIHRTASWLLTIIEFLDLNPISAATISEIESAAIRWEERVNACRATPINKEAAHEFRRRALNWFRYRGLLIENFKQPSPYGDVLPNFLMHSRNTRGLTAETVRNSNFVVLRFLRWIKGRQIALADISIRDVERYVADMYADGYKLRTIESSCSRLRSFFRFTEAEGITLNTVADGIRVRTAPKCSAAQRGPSWRDVRRLIGACSSDNPHDLRTRAILLLLAVYGLRSVEITSLKLNDIDWFEESFFVRRAKNGGVQKFPLQYEVGESILKYLKKGRSACSCRNLFVTLVPPYRPITVGNLFLLVRTKMKALAIDSPESGPRGFRHACATQLLNKGYSLPEIADFLGHHGTESVGIYAKSSAFAIRKVASFSLGGLR
jgi:integrase/recombinase XerD